MTAPALFLKDLFLLHLLHDGLESLGIVHGQVGEHLAVDLNTSLVNHTHELAVREVLHACSSVDAL